MEYRNDGQEQEYSLYTEKIVPSPKVKYRRVIRAVKLLVLIVFIGVVYVVSDKIVIPAVRYKTAVKNATVDRIEFTRDEYPDTVQLDSEDGIGQIKYDYDTIMQALRSKVIDVQRTVVTVREHIEENVIDDTVTGEDGASKGSSDSIQRDLKKMQDEDEELFSTVGIIVGYLNDRYMILTSQLYTDVTSEYDVIVQDAGEYKAELVCSDELTGISIISIDGSKVLDNDRQYMQVAELGNSYMLNKGDIVIASGKIYGTDGAVDYGTITNRTAYNSIDNNYEVSMRLTHAADVQNGILDIILSYGWIGVIILFVFLMYVIKQSQKNDNKVTIYAIYVYIALSIVEITFRQGMYIYFLLTLLCSWSIERRNNV